MGELQEKLPREEEMIIEEMAEQQSWGFSFPTLNFFIPWRFWKKNRDKVHNKCLRQTAVNLLNYQLSWCIYLALPVILLVPPGLVLMWRSFTHPETLDLIEFSPWRAVPVLLMDILISFGFFIIMEILLTFIWVTGTIALRNNYKKGVYSYKGILSLPLLKP